MVYGQTQDKLRFADTKKFVKQAWNYVSDSFVFFYFYQNLKNIGIFTTFLRNRF